ncbi:MAG: efflux RND transporter periplasmic adaptor subunit [Planctomycetia bacterium]|nr:MAG: efflux RND transporter periplasmic adaptor subunit [Planctomycetia bacterium]
MRSLVIALIVLVGGVAAAAAYHPPLRSWVTGVLHGPSCRHALTASNCRLCDPASADSPPCARHDVPAALCWRCDRGLIPAYRAAGDWCAEHGLPESHCGICRADAGIPTRTVSHDGHDHAADAGTADRRGGHDHAGHGDTCDHDHADHSTADNRQPAEHPGKTGTAPSAAKPAADACCPATAAGDTCAAGTGTPSAAGGPGIALRSTPRAQRPPSPGCTKAAQVVRLASPDVAQFADLRTVALESREFTRTVHCPAEITYNHNRMARLGSRAPGVLREIDGDLGERVRAGQTLALIDSAELASAKADYLTAAESRSFWQERHDRDRELNAQNLVSWREYTETQTRLNEAGISLSRARQRLRALGLDEPQIAEVLSTGDTSPLLAVVVPFDGMIVERDAVVGEVVDATRRLFTVADTSVMWAMLDAAGTDAGLLAVGQEALFRDDLGITRERSGTIVWVSTALDDRTRTLRARVELPNDDGALKANLFGRAVVQVQSGGGRLVVPRGAVQWDGCCNIVFVRQSAVAFYPRQVRLGLETDGWFEVLDGLNSGDVVVTQGSFLLKTELLKGEIGAGCCPDH